MLCGSLRSHAAMAALLIDSAHLVRLALHAWATRMIEATNTGAIKPHSMFIGLVTGTGEDTG